MSAEPIAPPQAPPLAAQRPAPRIALVRARYNPAGGAERFVQNAIQALRSQGASLTIVTRSWPDHDGSAIVLDPFYWGSLWRDASFARAACRALGERRFDLVQAHERIACCDIYRAGDGVHAQWLEERARTLGPLERLGKAFNPRHHWVLRAERRLYASHRLKAVICNSAMVLEEIVRWFGTPRDKLVVIRNAVDSALYHPGLRGEMRSAVRQQLGIPAEARVAVHVGSGFERKGVAAMLDAVARARAKPWAIVVGSDKRMGRYLARARRLGIAERVRFVGAVSDVRPYYAAADAFVLATLYDPQPNAALEAMACALPVVTTPRCGVAELLVQGESGFVHDALDAAGLAEAIDRLDPGIAPRIGQAARAAVLPHTPQAMARQYIELYERLLRR
jgi:UDP-glucose:(heptosyl)LPS alpha-1,3-glucosyltransferase